MDIGAFTASSEEGGKFLFFLYKEKMDRCLSVSLTPPQMHSVLTVFKNGEKEQILLHVTVKNILERYGVELLEIEIVRNEEYGRFYSRLLLFDGERESKTDADFIDGIIMAKLFGAPIYIDEPLMEQYSVAMENSPKETIQTDAIIRRMEDALSQAVRDEEYERAEVIKRRIEELKKEKDIERNEYEPFFSYTVGALYIGCPFCRRTRHRADSGRGCRGRSGQRGSLAGGERGGRRSSRRTGRESV